MNDKENTLMNDLEICKRIAEIEGVGLFSSYSSIFDKKKLISHYMVKEVKWVSAAESEEGFFTKVYSNPSAYHKARYNPLTDDALCFRLMVKYKVALLPCMGDWTAQTLGDGEGLDFIEIFNESPNKAICLAIIEANK